MGGSPIVLFNYLIISAVGGRFFLGMSISEILELEIKLV